MFIPDAADRANREGTEHIEREYANEWDALLYMSPMGYDGRDTVSSQREGASRDDGRTGYEPDYRGFDTEAA